MTTPHQYRALRQCKSKMSADGEEATAPGNVQVSVNQPMVGIFLQLGLFSVLLFNFNICNIGGVIARGTKLLVETDEDSCFEPAEVELAPFDDIPSGEHRSHRVEIHTNGNSSIATLPSHLRTTVRRADGVPYALRHDAFELRVQDFLGYFASLVASVRCLVLGQPGVGKSSFINLLNSMLKDRLETIAPAFVAAVHATTTLDLYSIRERFEVIDMPGVDFSRPIGDIKSTVEAVIKGVLPFDYDVINGRESLLDAVRRGEPTRNERACNSVLIFVDCNEVFGPEDERKRALQTLVSAVHGLGVQVLVVGTHLDKVCDPAKLAVLRERTCEYTTVPRTRIFLIDSSAEAADTFETRKTVAMVAECMALDVPRLRHQLEFPRRPSASSASAVQLEPVPTRTDAGHLEPYTVCDQHGNYIGDVTTTARVSAQALRAEIEQQVEPLAQQPFTFLRVGNHPVARQVEAAVTLQHLVRTPPSPAHLPWIAVVPQPAPQPRGVYVMPDLPSYSAP